MVSDNWPKVTLKQIIDGNGEPKQIDIYTCFDCTEWKKCPFAFDGYNTNGDCLAEK